MPERATPQLGKLALLTVFLAGCAAGPNESFFRVKGSLVNRAPAGSECVLQLHAKTSSGAVDYRSIGASFETEFVIPAGEAPYYFTAECPGGESYWSRVYQLGRSEDFNTMIDLGEMQAIEDQSNDQPLELYLRKIHALVSNQARAAEAGSGHQQ